MLERAALVEWKWSWKEQAERVIIQAVVAASSVTLRKSFNLFELHFHHLFSIFIECLYCASRSWD